MNTANAIINISINKLKRNYQVVSDYVKVPIMAIIKANAYGLGVEKIFSVFYNQGCRMFAVAYFEEFKQLVESENIKQINEKLDILILSDDLTTYLNSLNDLNIYQKINIIPVIYKINQIKCLIEYQKKYNYPLNFAIYFDTGFIRLGVRHEMAKFLKSEIKEHNLNNPKFVISHFANSNNIYKDKLLHGKETSIMIKHHEAQYERFLEICDLFPNSLKSISNSCGIFLDKKYHLDFVRSGKALYGLLKTNNDSKLNISNVFSFCAKILQLNSIEKGESIGYGQIFKAKEKMKIATISAGFADGIPYQFSYSNLPNNQNHYQHKCILHIKDKKYLCPIVGQVSMDTTTIDVTHVPDYFNLEGKMVKIIGDDTNHITNITQSININEYAMVLAIGNSKRVKKIYQE